MKNEKACLSNSHFPSHGFEQRRYLNVKHLKNFDIRLATDKQMSHHDYHKHCHV